MCVAKTGTFGEWLRIRILFGWHTHKPDMTKGFDKEFFERLLTEYRIQDPKDTMKAKVGTCNDVVVLMKSILDDLSIPSKYGYYMISKTANSIPF